MNQLLIMAPFRPHHVERIREAAGAGWELAFLPQDAPADQVRRALSAAQVVLGGPDPALLGESETLRWVQLTSAGDDPYTQGPIPFPAGVRLTNASGAFGVAISQYVLGQTLALLQNLPGYWSQQQRREWADRGPIGSLDGATVLIFGAGNLGGETARRLRGFDTYTVGVCRDTSRPRPDFRALCTMEEAEAWLPKADVVVGCLPYNGETRRYLNRRRLALLKTGAVLVNVGRGNFVDCDALTELLNRGRIRGAALDVTDPEPLPKDHPLWSAENCLITPHISGGSFGRLDAIEDIICDICCENLRRWNRGEPLKNVVY
ncbi:MAG: D-2-hydroxyacid dehydrogenase [Clostridiales bacterium]|nr:D-2-hydroxyacid dehydrogenase [Clostridiales bacterium]